MMGQKTTRRRLVAFFVLAVMLTGVMPAARWDTALADTVATLSSPSVPLFVKHQVTFYVRDASGRQANAYDDEQSIPYAPYQAAGFENPQSVSHMESAYFPDMTGVTDFTGWVDDTGAEVSPSDPVSESRNIFAQYAAPTFVYYNVEVYVDGADGDIQVEKTYTMRAEAGQPFTGAYPLFGVSGHTRFNENDTAPSVMEGTTVPAEDMYIGKIDGGTPSYYYNVVVETQDAQGGTIRVKLPPDGAAATEGAAVSYTVRHFREDPDAYAGEHSYPERLMVAETREGTAGELVTAEAWSGGRIANPAYSARAIDFAGYQLDEARSNLEEINASVVISPDGQTVVSLYYTLPTYSYTYDLNTDWDDTLTYADEPQVRELLEGSPAFLSAAAPEGYTLRLGQKLSVAGSYSYTFPPPVREGFEFTGWSYAFSGFEGESTPPATMPEGGIVAVATWRIARETPYQIVFHLQNAAQDGYLAGDEIEPYNGKGYAGELVEAGEASIPMPLRPRWTLDTALSDTSARIAPDGMTVFNLYLNRTPFTLTLGGASGETGVTLPWGADLTDFLSEQGFEAGEWERLVAETPQEDIRQALAMKRMPAPYYRAGDTILSELTLERTQAPENTAKHTVQVKLLQQDMSGKPMPARLDGEWLETSFYQSHTEEYYIDPQGSGALVLPAELDNGYYRLMEAPVFEEDPENPGEYIGSAYYEPKGYPLYILVGDRMATKVTGVSSGGEATDTWTIGQSLDGVQFTLPQSLTPRGKTFSHLSYDPQGELAIQPRRDRSDTYLPADLVMPDPRPGQTALLYAQYADAKLTVAFRQPLAGGVVKNVTVTYGETVEPPEAVEPEQGQYRLLGWQLVSTGGGDTAAPTGSLFDFDTPVYQDMVLEPMWEAEAAEYPYTVRYVDGEGEDIDPALNLSGEAQVGETLSFAARSVSGWILADDAYKTHTVIEPFTLNGQDYDNNITFLYEDAREEAAFTVTTHYEEAGGVGYQTETFTFTGYVGDTVDLLADEPYKEQFAAVSDEYEIYETPSVTKGVIVRSRYYDLEGNGLEDWDAQGARLNLDIYYRIRRETYQVVYYDTTNDEPIVSVERNNVKRNSYITETPETDSEIFARYTYTDWEITAEGEEAATGTLEPASTRIRDSSTVIRFNYADEGCLIRTSASRGGDIRPNNGEQPFIVPRHSSQVFTFEPLSDYTLEYILVDGVRDDDPPTSLELTDIIEDHEIYASFKPVEKILYTGLAENGSILPAASMEMVKGESRAITLRPNAEYRLTRLTRMDYDENGDGGEETEEVLFDINQAASGEAVPDSMTLAFDSDVVVNATFDTVHVTGYAGVADGEPHGVTVDYTPHVDDVVEYCLNNSGDWTTEPPEATEATAGNGLFVQVRVTNENYPEGAGRVISGYAFISLMPGEAHPSYSATAVVDGEAGGSVSPAAASVDEGKGQLFTFTPQAGYEVDWIEVNGVRVSDYAANSNFYMVNNVMEDTSLVVAFKQIPIRYAINVISVAGNGVILDPLTTGATVDAGESYTVFYKAGEGYELDKLEIMRADGSELETIQANAANQQQYALKDISANTMVLVYFKMSSSLGVQYSVDVTSEGEGGSIIYPASGHAEVNANEMLTIGYETKPGYEVESVEVYYPTGWQQVSGWDESKYTVFVMRDMQIRVTFAKGTSPAAQYVVNVTAMDGGAITKPAGEMTMVDGGSAYTVEFAPSEGYVLDRVEVNLGESYAPVEKGVYADRYEIESVDTNMGIRVYFRQDDGEAPQGETPLPEDGGTDRTDGTPGGDTSEETPPPTQAGTGDEVAVNVAAIGNGTITDPASGLLRAEVGTSYTIRYQAEEGYVLDMVEVDNGSGYERIQGAGETAYEMEDISRNASVRVSFREADAQVEEYTVTLTAEGGEITKPSGDGTASVRAGDALDILYTPHEGNEFDRAQYRALGGEEEEWTILHSATETGCTLENVTGDMEFVVKFRRDPTAPAREIGVGLAEVSYMYGESALEYSLALKGYADEAERDALLETLEAAIAAGGVTVETEATEASKAGDTCSYALSGPETALGDGYVAVYEEAGTLEVVKRPMVLRVRDVSVLLGESYQKRVTADKYDGMGGLLKADESSLKFDVGVENGASVTQVNNYTLVLTADPEENPNYDIHTENGTLKVLGRVTYQTNYPENFPVANPLVNTSYVDPVTYERDAIITMPAVTDTGFNAMGLTFQGWEVNGNTVGPGTRFKMGAGHVSINAVWVKTQYVLTVNYVLAGTETPVAVPDTLTYAYGDTYSVAPKQIAGYKTAGSTLTGTMPANGLSLKMEYTADEVSAEGTNAGGTGAAEGEAGGGSGGGSSASGHGIDLGGSGGGRGSGGSGGPMTVEEATSPRAGNPLFSIPDGDIPLGGVAARNVGDCYE